MYDVQGRLVSTPCNEFMEQGFHALDMNTSVLASGLYFVRIAGAGLNTMRSLTVIR
jgi:hypothetical protein